MHLKTGSRIASVSLLALALGSCAPLISFGGDGAAAIYSLEYQGDASSGINGAILYVEEPVMALGLDSRRVAVSLADHERTFVSDARWSSNLGDLVRGYFVRSLTAETDAQALGEGGLDVSALCRLGTTVWNFDFVPSADGINDKVELKLQFSLVRLGDGALLARNQFDVSERVSSSESRAIVSSYNAAMNKASDQLVDWLAPEFDKCGTNS